MKFTAESGTLADAAAWVAHALPAYYSMPVMSGIKLHVTDDGVEVSAFDHEISASAAVAGPTVHEPGTVLVPGKVFADLAARLPERPTDVTGGGAAVTIACGSSRYSLPTLPIEDYPALPDMPAVAGTVEGAAFATAVKHAALAAGRDTTVPVLCAIRVEVAGDTLTLAASDRYRIALCELPWQPADDGQAPPPMLIPARTLAAAAKTLGGGPVDLATATGKDGEAVMAGLTSGERQWTTRLVDDAGVDLRRHFDVPTDGSARIDAAALRAAVRRVTVVADRAEPVRLIFTSGHLEITAGSGDAASGSEFIDADLTSERRDLAFNPQFLLDAITCVAAPTIEMAFAGPDHGRRILLTPAETPTPAARHVLMPIRLSS